MKRYTFPLTIILLLFAVIALAAPGDKRPAVTSAAIGLGSSSSPTLASVTATTSVTAPSFNSTAADGYHYIRPYNAVAFAGTALAGMFVTTPTGPQWYNGSEWEAIGGGGASLPTQTGNSGKYLTTNGTAASWGTVSGSSSFTTVPTYSDATCTAGQYAFDASYAYFCCTANTWDRIALAGWSNPSPVAPTLSSATIGTDGTTLTLNMSASTSVGAGGSGGIVVTGSTSGALSGTYSSGAPGTSLVYALPSSIKSGETVTLAYTQPGNGLEGTTGGADVVTASGTSVTNNSTQTAVATIYYPSTYDENSFTGTDSITGVAVGSRITVTSSGNITKLGVKFADIGTATQGKIAIFPDGTGSLGPLSSTFTFTPTNGWQDIDITPYAVTAGTTYAVLVVLNANCVFSAVTASGWGEFQTRSFAQFADTGTISSHTKTYAVRMTQ